MNSSIVVSVSRDSAVLLAAEQRLLWRRDVPVLAVVDVPERLPGAGGHGDGRGVEAAAAHGHVSLGTANDFNLRHKKNIFNRSILGAHYA